MSTYKHPGVYVEEINTLPPSVAEVSTAIPAFIGYTETALDKDGNDLTLEPSKINTFLEYQTYFGGAEAITFEVEATEEIDENDNVTDTIIEGITQTGTLTRLMYHSVDLYFKNGGGPCYIVSVGSYNDAVSLGDDISGLQGGLKALEKKDEPTLIVIPDAVQLVDSAAIADAVDDAAAASLTADYYSLCQAVLAQCAEFGDRFAIFDILNMGNTNVADEDNFRDNIGTSNLKYGAAYYPYLQTALTYNYKGNGVAVNGLQTNESYEIIQSNCINISYNGDSNTPKYQITLGDSNLDIDFEVDINTPSVKIMNVKIDDNANHTGADIVAAWNDWVANNNNPGDYDIAVDSDGSAEVVNVSNQTVMDLVEGSVTLSSIASSNTKLYNEVIDALGSYTITLPPSAAIAGVYARVDRDRGVWKSPANVSLASVIKPDISISDAEQGDLNVDTNGGKSINCIRRFQGKGNMVWGARTLAGNDNEWRYIAVRRLFNFIEESVKKATSFAVFEPNDAPTWAKVKAMITGYLYQLWEKGALAGSSAETSYFVNAGLGTTMGTQDILEGRMIVEIGVAAVRPAEFIILRFSHKLQEA